MTTFKRLLAKNSKSPDTPRGPETLPGHTANVMAAAQTLLDETADVQLSAVGLSRSAWKERFYRAVLFAAFCHDLGKANDQFQSTVRGEGEQRQAIRHEAVSFLIIQQTALKEWLSAALEEPEDLSFILWAAAGHHRKFPPGEPAAGTGIRLSLILNHPDFQRTLSVGVKWLGLDEAADFGESYLATCRENVPSSAPTTCGNKSPRILGFLQRRHPPLSCCCEGMSYRR